MVRLLLRLTLTFARKSVRRLLLETPKMLVQISDLQKYADHFDDFLSDNPTIDGFDVTIVERDTTSFLAAVA